MNILRKYANLLRQYGPLGLSRICARAVAWFILSALPSASGYKKIKVKDGELGIDYEMYIDLKDDGISKALFIYGTRERDQISVLKRHLRQGSKILDIGANLGYYVILEAILAGPRSRIVAYEPSKDNFSLLKKNLTLNGLFDRVEANNSAVSNNTGTRRFYISEKSNLHTLNPARYRGAEAAEEKASVEVKAVDIYGIFSAHRDIACVRMDIEGHEVEVLGRIADAARDLNLYPDILFETHFPKYDSARHDIEREIRKLFALGYIPKILTSTDDRNSRMRQKGYRPVFALNTDRVTRGIYEGISKEDSLALISREGGVRAVLLRKE